METLTLPKKMKFSIKYFFGKCDQIRSFLPIWSHLLKKSLMDNFIFCVVKYTAITKTDIRKYATWKVGL